MGTFLPLYVVCYPRFAEAESQVIEAVRRQYDPQAGSIAAHITLVFAAVVDPDVAAAAMEQVAATNPCFEIGIGEVVGRPGVTDEGFYAYLLTVKGSEQLCMLHERLTDGLLGDAPTLPYEPHITLGRWREAKAMQAVVAGLQDRQLASAAEVSSLHLLAATKSGVRELARAGLAA